MTHPGRLTSNFIAQQTLPYTVYAVQHVWQHPPDYSESVLIGTRVEPVTVVAFGISPGCSVFPDITCVDIKGRKFIGHPCDYYMTEEAAQAAADADMDEANQKRRTAETHWINVNSLMPNEDQVVAVLCKDGDLLTAWPTHWHGASSGFAYWTFPHNDEAEVTHWYPLPRKEEV